MVSKDQRENCVTIQEKNCCCHVKWLLQQTSGILQLLQEYYKLLWIILHCHLKNINAMATNRLDFINCKKTIRILDINFVSSTPIQNPSCIKSRMYLRAVPVFCIEYDQSIINNYIREQILNNIQYRDMKNTSKTLIDMQMCKVE